MELVPVGRAHDGLGADVEAYHAPPGPGACGDALGWGAGPEGRGQPGHTAGAGWAGAERPIIGPERETQMGGIEQGGSERVARAAGPTAKRKSALPFLCRKDKTGKPV